MSTLITNLRYLPLVLVMALVLTAGVMAQTNGRAGAQPNVAETGTAVNAEVPQVTINEQPVNLDANGQASVQSPGETTVEVSGGTTVTTTTGDKTVTTNDAGGVDIRVESSSSSGTSRTHTRIRGSNQVKFEGDASIEVKVKGEGGNISVSTE